ncbi:hypothetical protein ETD86_10200 [Nonomuraea turkmeniaca]|uniref:Uncharacterized protein n=1 Tax=Nonomuraea turkmeniaca TaxID=103838 RepID=A0A5S4FRE8_9ACTN|nr:hypothetical protein [Nonomuraea turkmeniaca]TMR22791.1 hypothetical protein ETD86_10200 [Nonomuraea turkmeniaca]
MIMRVVAGAAAGFIVFSGTAAADPITAAELIANDLYKAGKLAKTSCTAKKGTTKAATEKYIRTLVGCLGKAWRKDAVKVEISYHKDGKKKYKSWPFVTGEGIYVGLADDWVKTKNELPVFHAMASVYGEVVQVQTGIATAAKTLDYGGDEKLLEQQERRYSYQQDCLAGAAAKALGRPAKGWKLKGNQLYWFDQGYKAGGPSACNTWKASASKVA